MKCVMAIDKINNLEEGVSVSNDIIKRYYSDDEINCVPT